MTEREFYDDVFKAVVDYWPNHRIEPAMQRQLWRRFRGYQASMICTFVGDYARENPDERYPRGLWAYVSAKAERGPNQSGPDVPCDQYGITENERANIVREVRISSPHTRQMSDDAVYSEWLDQNGYRRPTRPTAV